MVIKFLGALLAFCFWHSLAVAHNKQSSPLEFYGPQQVLVAPGVSLSAWAFYSDATAKPVILAFTPYSPQALADRAQFFAAKGYVFLVVSTRGRGDSGGHFQPFSPIDGQDAAQVIAWAARQPWSNGQVAMWGGSYVGYSQWAALSQLPHALKTIVPAAAVFPGIDYPAYNNIRFNYSFQWLQALQGRGDWFQLAFRDDLWATRIQQVRASGHATADLAVFTGTNQVIAEQWLQHSVNDNYWRAAVPSDATLAQARLPVLTITGYFDADQRGALAHHRRYVEAGSDQRQLATLLIGPWDHSGTRSPSTQQAGITVENGSVLDMNNLHLSWYDWVFKQTPKPPALRSGIHYFLMGADEWHYTETWPDSQVAWYLHSLPSADYSAAKPGLLGQGKAAAASFQYQFSPERAGQANPVGFNQLANEQRDVLAIQGDGLVFVSNPLAAQVDLVGQPKLELHLSITSPDADIFVLLEELMEDGSTLRLSYDMKRLRHRGGLDKNQVMHAGQVYSLRFDSFTFIARRLAKGSRLRLSLHSNPPLYLEHNYGGIGPVSQQRRGEIGPIQVKVSQQESKPAVLWLPFLQD
jgi:putative CocE/NonD family hydrolase